MKIRRAATPADRFTITSNEWIRDSRLSWEARSLLIYLQSHATGFEVDIETIVNAGPAGRTKVRAMIAELKMFGYLKVVQSRDRRGRMTPTEYVLCDPGERENLQVGTGVTKPDSGDHLQGNDPENPQVGTGVTKPDSGHTGQTENLQVRTGVRFPDSGQPAAGPTGSGEQPPIRRPVKEEKIRSTPVASLGAAEQTTLIVVDPADVLPPKINASTVAGAYVDAYKAAHNGAAPPQTPARVGSDAKRLLKADHDPAELLAAAALMGERGLQTLTYALQQLRRPPPAARNRADQNDAVLRAEYLRAIEADEADSGQTRGWGNTA